MSQSYSQRVVSEGFSNEEIEIIDDFIEELKQNKIKSGSKNWKFVFIMLLSYSLKVHIY